MSHSNTRLEAVEATLPQAVAAETYTLRPYNHTILLACRPFHAADKNPLSRLPSRHYEMLRLAALGLTSREIGIELGPSPDTPLSSGYVDNYFSQADMTAPNGFTSTGIFNALGVSNRYQAASYIPIDERRLRSFSLTKAVPTKSGYRIVSKLGQREQAVCELLSEGMLVKNVAAELGIHRNTVNYITPQIRKKLGCRNLTELLRLHGAMTNLDRYRSTVESTAVPLQNTVRKILMVSGLSPESNRDKTDAVAAYVLRRLQGFPQAAYHFHHEVRGPIAREVVRQEVAACMRPATGKKQKK